MRRQHTKAILTRAHPRTQGHHHHALLLQRHPGGSGQSAMVHRLPGLENDRIDMQQTQYIWHMPGQDAHVSLIHKEFFVFSLPAHFYLLFWCPFLH